MDKFQSKYFNTAILMDEALLLLLEKKDYQYITVKEICQKAGVNRSTFYLHYETMDDLLKEAIAMINKRFYESFGSKKDAFKGDWKMSKNKSELVLITPDYLKPYLEFIKENKISIYDEEKQNGAIRHIVIKAGKYTKQIMCILVVNEEIGKTNENKLVEMLCTKYKDVKTIVKNINNKNTNVILGKQNVNLYGDGYIEDKLGEYTFKISPMSFYQVNPIQAEVLYNTAIEAANLSKEDTLFDLYCGIGTIGIFASKFVKQVYGIEIVEQAIEDAKENAKINKVDNAEFICGDVEFAFDELINKKKIIPTAIIVDPPRKGLDEKTIQNILKIKPEKLVYISCNPATMVRDIAKTEGVYVAEKIQPVDMFPYTSNVECVAVLKLK